MTKITYLFTLLAVFSLVSVATARNEQQYDAECLEIQQEAYEHCMCPNTPCSVIDDPPQAAIKKCKKHGEHARNMCQNPYTF